MTPPRRIRALGLMSGTSLDGIDAALVETDGRAEVVPGPAATTPYPAALRARLKAALGRPDADAGLVEALTDAHAAAVAALLRVAGLGPDAVDVIGFHGHTILHRPETRLTVQIGDGARLARATGIRVVNDFRSADVRAGGQGAPFVPLYHQALAAALPRPLAVVNIGGVANVTWIGAGAAAPIAFDTGPGNAPIDDWAMAVTGRPVDEGGALAGAGRVAADRVAAALAHPYFGRRPPKSLDREDFTAAAAAGLSPADGAATLTAITAAAIAAAARHFPAPARRWIVTGGGRHNPVLMAALAAAVGAPVDPVETVGWDGDALEAQAFGYLAVRALNGLPLSLPSTTGVPEPMPGGIVHPVAA